MNKNFFKASLDNENKVVVVAAGGIDHVVGVAQEYAEQGFQVEINPEDAGNWNF